MCDLQQQTITRNVGERCTSRNSEKTQQDTGTGVVAVHSPKGNFRYTEDYKSTTIGGKHSSMYMILFVLIKKKMSVDIYLDIVSFYRSERFSILNWTPTT